MISSPKVPHQPLLSLSISCIGTLVRRCCGRGHSCIQLCALANEIRIVLAFSMLGILRCEAERAAAQSRKCLSSQVCCLRTVSREPCVYHAGDGPVDRCSRCGPILSPSGRFSYGNGGPVLLPLHIATFAVGITSVSMLADALCNHRHPLEMNLSEPSLSSIL